MNPTTRSELFMAAAAGENVTPPTPTTREEYFLKKIAENAGGGGGGAGTFTVHMFGPTMVDKTFAEISQAVKSGKDVRLVYEEEDSVSVYYLVRWNADSMAQFIRIFHTDSSLMTVYTVNVFSDGTVTDYSSEGDLYMPAPN